MGRRALAGHVAAQRGGVARASGIHAAVVSFLSGDSYVQSAVCLQRQLAAVGSSFPLVLILDDRPRRAFSQDSRQQLRDYFGAGSLVMLSSLYDRLSSDADQNSQAFYGMWSAGNSRCAVLVV